MGLPTHVLLVHGAVVLVPLLAVGAVLYALVPKLRPRLTWVVLLLAVVAPLAALFTKLSGDAFFAALQDFDPPRIGGELLEQAQQHQQYGTITAWITGALGLVALLMIYLVDRTWPSWAPSSPGTRRGILLGLTAVTVALALADGYYIFQTGDSGARMAWDQLLSE